MSFRLYKKEKLRGEITVARLFDRSVEGNCSALVFPLRVAFSLNDRRAVKCPQFLVSIPKKRLHHAVDRVKMRRRVREAYRLNRHLLPPDLPVDIAFIYVASELKDYAAVERAVTRLLTKISQTLAPDSNDNQ
ncbi:MAG: ribonuclease P protein component [Duncaniella sp.]|nr:ribonuclease P protein component [Duncaniella sp.]HBI59092.1 hypothetical protein [Porphyromonadaceae bacterium]